MTRYLLLAVCIGHCALATAQCTSTYLGLDPVSQTNRFCDLERTSDGMVALLKPYHYGVAAPLQPHSATVVKADPSGVPIWTRRLLTANPHMSLDPVGVRSTLDDGVIVHGNLFHDTYVNQFVIKLTATGDIEWARIYMLPDTNIAGHAFVHNRVVRENSMVALSDGRYGWALGNEWEFYHVILDANGIPVSARSYGDAVYPMSTTCVNMRPDGSWHAAHCGTITSTTLGGYFKVDAAGDVLWAKRIPYEMQPAMVTSTANGDVFICLQDFAVGQSLIRANASGTVLWRRQGAGTYLEELEESSDGTLVGTNNAYLVQLSSGGVQLARLSYGTYGFHDVSLVGSQVLAAGGSWSELPTFFLANDVSEFSSGCGLTVTSTQSNTLGSVSPTANIIVRDTTTINTWTLAMNEFTGNDLDLIANVFISGARPGWQVWFSGSITNPTGTDGGAVTITCTLPDNITPTSFTPAPTTINGNVLTWSLPNGVASDGMWHFQGGGSLPPDPLLIGTTITATLSVTEDVGETDLTNNTYSYTREVTSSYDPNDKLVHTSTGLSDSLYYPDVDEWLDYTIRFQNTGNDTAFNVVLVDSLPATLRVGSFLPMGATHAYTYELNGSGLLRFTFADIQLPDSATNEPASKGMVSFRIKPVDDLPLGTVITNRAGIYFDINDPVITPDATVTISGPLSVPEATSGQLVVFPVPASGSLSALLPNGFAAWRWTIRAADGRRVASSNVVPIMGRFDLPIRGLASGTYILTLEGSNGERLSGRFVTTAN